METMHAAGRRRLPPVPRPAGDRSAPGQVAVAASRDRRDGPGPVRHPGDRHPPDRRRADRGGTRCPHRGPHDADAADDDEIDATQQLQLHELVALICEDDDRRRADDEPTTRTGRRPSRRRPTPSDRSVEAEAEPDVVAEVEDAPDAPAAPDRTPVDAQDPAQQFVARLRSCRRRLRRRRRRRERRRARGGPAGPSPPRPLPPGAALRRRRRGRRDPPRSGRRARSPVAARLRPADPALAGRRSAAATTPGWSTTRMPRTASRST